MNNKLKYLGYSVVFQEVPNEVTLAINISGCPHRCEGCHSQYLWEYVGEYIADDITNLMKRYAGLITCVCFMGGDQNPEELSHLANIVKQNKLKVALYSGSNKAINQIPIYQQFDYVKIGHYDQTRGGLDSKSTNQKMYQRINSNWADITYKFQTNTHGGLVNDQGTNQLRCATSC